MINNVARPSESSLGAMMICTHTEKCTYIISTVHIYLELSSFSRLFNNQPFI